MKMQKIIHILLLVIVLCLATYLRFYKLTQSDFVNGDEYIYYFGADIGMTLKRIFFGFGDMLRQGKLGHNVSGLIKHLPNAVKPGYYFLTAIATSIMGESKATAFFISAFFGVLSVAALYLLVQILFNSRRMALIAALFLAVSSGHVLFTRMAHQVSGAIFFLIISFFFYVKSRKEINRTKFFLTVSGLFYGISFAVHPSVIYLIPAFFLFELHRFLTRFWNNKNWNAMLSFLKNLFLFFGIFLSALIFWEIPRFLVHIMFILRGRISPFSNYFTALIPINNIQSYIYRLFEYWKMHSVIRPDFSFFYFPSFLIDSQGIFYFALLIISLIYLMVKLLRHIDDYRYLLLAAWAGIIYILYSLPVGYRELRVFILILPALSIILAFFFDNLLSAFKDRIIKRAITVVALLLIVYFSVGNCYEIINSQFSYKPVKDFLLANPSIDKVLLNVNTMGWGPPEKVFDGLDGFVIPDTSFEFGGKIYIDKKSSRIAVFYRHPEKADRSPIFMGHQHRYGVRWNNIEKLYKEGRVRYLLTSVFDYQWFLRRPLKAEPIFYYRSPFVCKTRAYDTGYHVLDTFHNEPYFRRIGIYDLKDIFEEKSSR